MRRILVSTSAVLSLLVLAALPAAATEGGVGEAGTEAIKGGMDGVVFGLLVGVIFGIVVVAGAYRSRFGGQPAHQEQAHDIREGVGGHEPQETTPTGSA